MNPSPPDLDLSSPLEVLSGTVERVTFHSPENGFCVLRVRVPSRREPVTVVGNAAVVSPGEQLRGEGHWVNDRQHGLQFKAEQLRIAPPATLAGIEKYLGSGMVRGIGPHFAAKLVRAFGEEVFTVIEGQPQRLTELPGIGPKRRAQVVAAWAEQRVVRDIMVFLQSHGLGSARAVRIYKTYGEAAIDRVREDPYRLARDIHGIGFDGADRLARQLGLATDSPLRARAGLRHVLRTFTAQGHCAARREELLETATRLLEMEPAVLEVALAAEIDAERLVAEAVAGKPWIFPAPLARAEAGVAALLARLLNVPPPWQAIDPEQALPWVEARSGLTLSDSQRRAVALAWSGKVTVITGGPGVGKTTVVNTILQVLAARGVKMELGAPTGRAARRLAESTGREARTLHRLLEFDPREGGFKRNADQPLKLDLLVVDEVSMVDVVLMHQLLLALPPQAGLLLVGDVDQLPSVGPGMVLHDIITSGRVPVARLSEIFRQAARSRIVINAHRINRGQLPEKPGPDEESDFYLINAGGPDMILERLIQVVTERIPRRFGLHPVRDIQVLTPMNRAGLGARALNAELQQCLNPHAQPRVERFGWRFAPGDKVIQTLNDYDKEVFNGDIGRILKVEPEEGLLTVDYEGREVDYEFAELDELALAYATTVHKSQGSEYPAVVIPLAAQHHTLLERNLLYTAITRGRRLVVVIAEPRALKVAVETVRAGQRLTRLAARLRGQG